MKKDRLIVIVDDEADIRELVELHLKRAGYATAAFENGSDFLRWMDLGGEPLLCVLDIMLPDIQGTDLCRRLRNSDKNSTIPVIMLTALGHETDRVTGLELGADDYVTKPFSPRELVARVRAVLRRAAGSSESSGGFSVLSCGMIEIDTDTYTVRVKGKRKDFTSTEFRILALLMEGKGRVLSRSKLLDLLWGGEKFVFERTIDVHIRHIREKLGEASSLILNVRGVGYRLGETEE